MWVVGLVVQSVVRQVCRLDLSSTPRMSGTIGWLSRLLRCDSASKCLSRKASPISTSPHTSLLEHSSRALLANASSCRAYLIDSEFRRHEHGMAMEMARLVAAASTHFIAYP